MAIQYTAGNPLPYSVVGRVGFTNAARRKIDEHTRSLHNLPILNRWDRLDPLGPAERMFAGRGPNGQHQQGPAGALALDQHTGRAHHVSDQNIQQLICDYLNDIITLGEFLNCLSILFSTSWIDVILPKRLFIIWDEWIRALRQASTLFDGYLRRHPPGVPIANQATKLAKLLSSALSNLRVGHQVTDGALNQAIAPRLQRGMMDLIGYFVYRVSGAPNRPMLSVETSLISQTWDARFIAHPPPVTGGLIRVNNVFLGFSQGASQSVLISEENVNVNAPGPQPAGRVGANIVASTQDPIPYPGTQGSVRRSFYRIQRSACHCLSLPILGFILFYLGFTMFRGLVPAYSREDL
ncbi:MAG: hypothetical protein MI785_09380 [Kiloniellales bacterium]|nr:hypothetical protein [Kiloniellales bacterium]